MASYTKKHNVSSTASKVNQLKREIARLAADLYGVITSYNSLNTSIEDGFIDIPLWGCQEADGTPLAAFADGVSVTPGLAVGNSKALGIRWNNHATPDPIGFQFSVPPDIDTDSDMTLHVIASKTGATLADAVTWTVTAFNIVDGTLHDADSDFGGVSSAMTGDATAKTVQHETLDLAAANLVSSPAAVSVTIQPTDGTLGTDDVIIQGIYLTYKRDI